jgi:hypothetical protein
MAIAIILAGVVVLIERQRFMWCQLFQPSLKVLVQASFIIIDEHRRCDVHRIAKHQAFLDTTFTQAGIYLWCDIDKTSSRWDFKPELFSK